MCNRFILSLSTTVLNATSLLGQEAPTGGLIELSKEVGLKELELTQEALKPQKKSAKLEHLLSLVNTSQLNHQEFLDDVLSGDTLPWQNLLNNQAEMQKQVEELSATYSRFLAAESPADIEGASNELFRILNLIGPYLQSADYAPSDQSITNEEVAFLEKIELADRGPAALPDDLKQKVGTLELTGPSSVYTLLHLPVPIALKAEPNATIYLTTGTGGGFSNGLSMQVINADENGNALTYWKSPGDSVGPGTLLITSPQAINHISTKVTVVKPLLINIPDVNQIKQLGKSAIKTLPTLIK